MGGGCYCNDNELQTALAKVESEHQHLPRRLAPTALTAKAAPQPPTTKFSLLEMVFENCDVDGDGNLNESEMLTFAKHTGFDGPDDIWHEEYERLCRYCGVAAGISLQLLA